MERVVYTQEEYIEAINTYVDDEIIIFYDGGLV